jgi:hypothetical protein
MSYAFYFSLAALIVIAPHAPRRPAVLACWISIVLALGCNLGWWLK